jgi:uncharacterized iron-regulated membrane protein
MNRFFYSVHKWISAIAFVQLAIWTVTGFLFACISQESIRSEPVEGAHRGVVAAPPAITIARAIEIASAAGAIERVDLRATPSGTFYVVKGDAAIVRVDATSGALAPVTRDEAEATARRDQPGAPAVRATTLLTEGTLEYRDCGYAPCSVPAFRVELADRACTTIYVDARTGDVTARRNDRWRTYDVVWSLHIMDYKGREDFNHLLIRAAAALAIFTVVSGIALTILRGVRWTRRLGGGRPKRAAA